MKRCKHCGKLVVSQVIAKTPFEDICIFCWWEMYPPDPLIHVKQLFKEVMEDESKEEIK